MNGSKKHLSACKYGLTGCVCGYSIGPDSGVSPMDTEDSPRGQNESVRAGDPPRRNVDLDTPKVCVIPTIVGSHQVVYLRNQHSTYVALIREGDKAWNLPGGKRQGQEHMLDTLVRELHEEGVDHCAPYDQVVASSAPGVDSMLYVRRVHALDSRRGTSWFTIDQIRKGVLDGTIASYTLRHLKDCGLMTDTMYSPNTLLEYLQLENENMKRENAKLSLDLIEVTESRKQIREDVIDTMKSLRKIIGRTKTMSSFQPEEKMAPLWAEVIGSLDRFLNAMEKLD